MMMPKRWFVRKRYVKYDRSAPGGAAKNVNYIYPIFK